MTIDGAPDLLDVRALTKRIPVRSAGRYLHAADDVSFSFAAGECVGMVVQSGCGKSTLVRLIACMLDSDAGRLVFDCQDIGALPAARFASSAARGRIQMVFHDPADSLNPRFTAFDAIAEPLRRLGSPDARSRA